MGEHKVLLLQAGGSVYSEDLMAQMDFASSYLKTLLGFRGYCLRRRYGRRLGSFSPTRLRKNRCCVRPFFRLTISTNQRSSESCVSDDLDAEQ